MKEKLKEKILPFIIGLLVGAIIVTGCFYLLGAAKKNGISQGEFNGGPAGMHERGERPNFENGERPEFPEGMTEDGEKHEKSKEDTTVEKEQSNLTEETNTENV